MQVNIQALVAGPFGAIVGGWLGKGSGLSRAAEDKELERIGMTRESAKLMQQVSCFFDACVPVSVPASLSLSLSLSLFPFLSTYLYLLIFLSLPSPFPFFLATPCVALCEYIF